MFGKKALKIQVMNKLASNRSTKIIWLKSKPHKGKENTLKTSWNITEQKLKTVKEKSSSSTNFFSL